MATFPLSQNLQSRLPLHVVGIYRMRLRLKTQERLTRHSEQHQPRSLRQNRDFNHILLNNGPPAPARIADVEPLMGIGYLYVESQLSEL